jgi:hypothetical protein
LGPRAGVVNYTLWRNGQLIGRVRISFPMANSDTGIAGMLEVDEAFTDIDEMMQSSPPGLSGSPVFQSLLRDAHQGPGPVALRELSEEEARGVPAERMLIIHDSAGVAVPFRFLMIQRIPAIIPDRGELVDLCRERGITPSPWILLAH